jgi:hypothetical protein
MPMLSKKHRFALLVALATLGAPLAAQAQRKSPLADAPRSASGSSSVPRASSWARARHDDQSGLLSHGHCQL